jgi:hypothetical protein
MSRVSAADLAVFASRFVPKKQDESKLSADEYWHAHPELSEERFRRTAQPGMPSPSAGLRPK